MYARNDNGLANEMRASKAMFGWRIAKGKTGLLAFPGDSSHKWCVMGWQKTGKESNGHVLWFYCIDCVKLD